TNEHFDEIGARNAEERHLGFTRDSLGQQGLTGARRPDQQYASRNTAAQTLELAGVAQEFNQLLHVFFGFVAPGDVSKGDVIGVLVEHASARLTKTKRTALTAPLHLTHEENPHPDQQ